MPHRDYVFGSHFYETIYPIGIKPEKTSTAPLPLHLPTFPPPSSQKNWSKYLPKYELFVSTQKIARGSITLSSLPSNNPLLFKFIHVRIFFFSSLYLSLTLSPNSLTVCSHTSHTEQLEKVGEHFNQTSPFLFFHACLTKSLRIFSSFWTVRNNFLLLLLALKLFSVLSRV